MKRDFLILIGFALFAIAFHFGADMLGYSIEWTAVGICLTAIIAVWQLRENSVQKAVDRALETKRDILFDGVRGMSQALPAFSALSNINVPFLDSARVFQLSMSQVTVASSVAQLRTATAGKNFTDKLGPLFLHAMAMRAQLDQLPGGAGNPRFMETHKQLAAFVLDSSVETAKAMLRAIAAVRTDVGIAKESEEMFLKAVFPDEALIKAAIDKALGRTP